MGFKKALKLWLDFIFGANNNKVSFELITVLCSWKELDPIHTAKAPINISKAYPLVQSLWLFTASLLIKEWWLRSVHDYYVELQIYCHLTLAL